MYKEAIGIIETLAPLHVGATAGEEGSNLNLIFRDQFTQSGIIPGSSIRGRLRAEMQQFQSKVEADKWYGKEATPGVPDSTSESLVKIEYASIVWLPVFCPGQPIVWVSCPYWLKRYQRIAGNLIKINENVKLKTQDIPDQYAGSQTLEALEINGEKKLFFNFGFLTVEKSENLLPWFPLGKELPAVIVADDEISMIHDMALYRQSRVCLEDNQKKVKSKQFFNTEALPEGTILVFAIALKDDPQGQIWQPFKNSSSGEIYLGGLESIGFGHCYIEIRRKSNGI